MLGLGRADDDVRDILDIDRPAVARREQEQADIGDALQSLAGENGQRLAAVAERADEKRAIGVGQLVDQLIERHAIDGQAFGIGLDANLVRAAADDIGAADVVDFDQLVLKFLRHLKEPVVRPLRGLARGRRERQIDDRDVVDAAADDQRLRYALRQVGDIGADLLVNAQDRGILVRPDEEARGDHDAVVLGLRIDVLDAVDALDDVLERPGDELDRLVGLVAVGLNDDVDHRHADLRLLLARQRGDGDEAGDDRGDQEKRGQRRIDERAGEETRKPELHGDTSSSPSLRPARISTFESCAAPSWTTTSVPSASLA